MNFCSRTIRPRHLTLVVLGALVIAGGCQRKPAGPATAGAGPQMNVVLISIDSLRADHLSCYGYSRPTSPNIDRFAARATVFEQMTSSTSWTLPAHAAMFTGLVDSIHGANQNRKRLDESRTTLAEILKAAGYCTAGFFSGPFLHPSYGLGQGFETYVDCSSTGELAAQALAAGRVVGSREVNEASHRDITNPRIHAQVSAWLEANKRTPFFLFVHYWDVHFDYIPPPPYDTRFDPNYTGTIDGRDFESNVRISNQMAARDLQHIIALYDGEIAWTDEHVGKLLDELERLGLGKDTLVILTADHGDEFFEHGGKGHRRTLFDEVTHVPLIIRDPRLARQTPRVATQTRMIDITPTILDMLGMQSAVPTMGQSLRPALDGKPLEHDVVALSELFLFDNREFSFRRPDYKLIQDPLRRLVLYDLKRDPGEHEPLTDPQSALMARAWQDREAMQEWTTLWSNRIAAASAPANAPEPVQRSLRTLGYVGNDEPQPESQPNAPLVFLPHVIGTN